MSYQVKKYKTKAGAERWKVLFEERSGGKRRARAVSRDEDGFHPGMTYEQAKSVADKLNADLEVKRLKVRRLTIAARLNEEDAAVAAYLGEADIAAFESRHFGRRFVHENDKAPSYWRACKRCLFELKLNPADWEDERAKFYDWFRANGYALSTIQKLLYHLNAWGKFVSKAYNRVYYPIPAPRGIERSRLREAWSKKGDKSGNKRSLPLKPELLESKRSQLSDSEYAWLCIALYFGLRPEEVDGCVSGDEERVLFEELDDGTKVLGVYQTKVMSWKRIPVEYPEQEKAWEQIQAGTLPRPGYARIRKVFGAKYGLYMGRHGFVKWMKANGEALENVQLWMGHSDIGTTAIHYVDRIEVARGKRGRAA